MWGKIKLEVENLWWTFWGISPNFIVHEVWVGVFCFMTSWFLHLQPANFAASQGLRIFRLKWIYHRLKVTRIFWHTFYIRFMLWRIEKKKQAFARAEQSTVTISGISGDGLEFYCCQWLSMKRFQVFLLEMNLGTKGFTTRINSLPWNSKEITNGIRNHQSCINQQNGRGRNIWTSIFCVGVVVFIHDFHEKSRDKSWTPAK